jgi:hypothetical protein
VGVPCPVLPEEDAVVAITSGTRDMQRINDLARSIMVRLPLRKNLSGESCR